MIGAKIDSRWIGLHGPTSRISWIQNELIRDHHHQRTQIQPRSGAAAFPLGGELTTERERRHRREGVQRIAAASSSGARLMAGAPDRNIRQISS